MKNAELIITLQAFGGSSSLHVVAFDSAESAKSEFYRIVELLKKQADRRNDLPKFLVVESINKLTCHFDSIVAVAVVDFAEANEHERGVKETFPYLGWKT